MAGTMMPADRTQAASRIGGFALVAALLLAWEASVRLGWVQSQSWPALSAVLADGFVALKSGELLGVVSASIGRMVVGYVAGSALGIVLGIVLARIDLLGRFTLPVLEAFRPLPVPAIVPPLMLFLGVDDAMKIFVVAFSCFFPALVSTVGGVRAVDSTLTQTARTFRVGAFKTMIYVVLPAAAPSIFAGLRINLALALVTTVVAEMIAGSSGIGSEILQAQYSLRSERMYALVLCLMVIGYVLNAAFVKVERAALFWNRLRS
jgi:ABC-type nitrate/sulfonate/bicarbonate transport system permease component